MQRLIDASLAGNVGKVTTLLESAMNPKELVNKGDERGFRALHIAVMMGASECAKKLLEAGADPKVSTKDGATPIVMAAQGSGVESHPELEEGGAAKCIQYLLDAGADQTERDEVVGTVPMHVAIYRGSLTVLEALLAGPGGEVAANTKDTEGATPLHIACRKKGDAAPEAMAMLADGCPVKVDVGVVDNDGRTPLGDAAHHGHAEVVKLLLSAGSDPSSRDQTGMTPLAVAAWLGKEACLDAILATEAGVATVNVPNNLGATPLIFACQENFTSIAERLIAAGASLDAKDVSGKTPYLIAKVQKAWTCVDLLREKHGRPTPEEEKFDASVVTLAVSLKAGTLTTDSGNAVSFKTEPDPNGSAFEPVAKVKMPFNPDAPAHTSLGQLVAPSDPDPEEADG
eukprot:g9195.t1